MMRSKPRRLRRKRNLFRKRFEEGAEMKKIQLTAAALAGMILLASCGAKTGSDFIRNADSGNYAVKSEEAFEEYADESSLTENQNRQDDYSMEAEAAEYKQAEAGAINIQMLVYSCDMSIDVLEFDESVDKLHDLISKYHGFIESETYSDGGNTSKWAYTDALKWKTLSTVIRIPSASYDAFCKDAENVGDLRNKNASVQNLSAEYSDLKTTLKIYEAKEKRYLDLLADMKNENDAISVEKELTNIQIEIARIKTRMNNIENDVAYSYINLTVNEVREYTEEPVIEKTDTFGQRLKNTISGTWNRFLAFLEGMLFLLIRLLPYLLLIGILLFLLNQVRKAIKKKRAARDAAWYQAQKNQAKPEEAAKNENAETDAAQEEREADQ